MTRDGTYCLSLVIWGCNINTKCCQHDGSGVIARSSWIRFPPEAGPFYVKSACSPHVHVGLFPPGAPVSPTIKTCILVYLQSAPMTEVLAKSLESVPRQLHCGCPLLLMDWLNAATKFHCMLWIWPVKDFHLLKWDSKINRTLILHNIIGL